jgi:thiol:disulfide interchange protein
LGGRGRRISEFEASLVYKVSARTARATQRHPVSKKQNKTKKKEKRKRKKLFDSMDYSIYSLLQEKKKKSNGQIHTVSEAAQQSVANALLILFFFFKIYLFIYYI